MMVYYLADVLMSPEKKFGIVSLCVSCLRSSGTLCRLAVSTKRIFLRGGEETMNQRFVLSLFCVQFIFVFIFHPSLNLNTAS